MYQAYLGGYAFVQDTTCTGSGPGISNGPITLSATRQNIPAGLIASFTFSVQFLTDCSAYNIVASKSYVPNFSVTGSARHSVYNTLHESQCVAGEAGVSTKPTLAYLTTYTPASEQCSLMQVSLGKTFMQQTTLNGTGVSANYGAIKPLVATAASVCSSSAQLPPGAIVNGSSTNNVFEAVSGITGACNIPLDDTMVAANPVSNASGAAKCGDNNLAVDGTNANVFSQTRLVEDKCPACAMDALASGGVRLHPHFDNYSTDAACFGHHNTDQSFSPAWTADVRNQSQ